jgi:predicted SnoaL-like aldol condensation-catalyzing enzyme
MDKPTNETKKSRRGFLSIFTNSHKQQPRPAMVKMLTADGKLVEVEKSVLEAASKKQKSTNKEIYAWMNNPSKENK